MKAAFVGVFAATLLLATSLAPASAEDAGVRAFHDRFFAAWNTADLDTIAQSLTDDTVYHPMNGATLSGRAAVVDSYRQLMAANAVTMDVTPEVLEAVGPVGLASGLYTIAMTPKSGGETIRRSGRYFMELRQNAGVWRIARELTQTTADTAPTTTPAEATAAKWVRQPIPDGAGYAATSRPWLLHQPKVMKRRFADLAEGQVHYWHGAPPGRSKSRTQRPLIFMHPGPQTARVQVPLLDILAETRPVYAPDLMGMGDSSPPRTADGADPDLGYYADAALRFADAVGLKEFDLMGSSLGGYVAVEIAVRAPQRARHLIINRLNIMTGELLDEFTKYHGPKVVPDQQGLYVMFLWSRLKDLYTYVPWFQHEAANLRGRGLPSPEIMHITFTEQVKMATTQYLAFNAYWRYPIAERFAQLKIPVMAGADGAALLPGAVAWNPRLSGDVIEVSEDELRAYAAEAIAFLDR
ncbi:MAG: alpha/beta fold hydrolase [Rhodospirillaceae bacterium]|nr:alpha/beta fold hydrolase [Rhodospirillaceae bacterium]